MNPSRPSANRMRDAPAAQPSKLANALSVAPKVDRVLHAVADVRLREIPERGPRAPERFDPGRVDPEPERLREHDDYVEDGAEADRARDRERDVAAGVVRLLA